MGSEGEDFEFRYWSPRSPGLVVMWRSGRLWHSDARERVRHEVVPTPADWLTFWEVLDRLHVWEWEPSFTRHGVDGKAWSLLVRRGSERAECQGSGAEPVGFRTLYAVIQRLLDGGLAEAAGGLLKDSAQAGRAFEPPATGVEGLSEVLRISRDTIEREGAIRALGRAGWQALPALPGLLAAMRDSRRNGASPVAEHALAAIARSVESADAAAVAPLLDPVLPVLIQAAGEGIGDDRLMAALARMAPARLMDFLRHPRPAVVRAAAKAFVEAGGVAPIETLPKFTSFT